MKEKSIAIIPARGGSKRIPRKNIKEFLGHPILKYSIEAALQSGCFDEVMVSTDDEEIAEIAQQLGATIPFLRSAEAANDYATTAEVLKEVLAVYKQEKEEFKYVCCIYPTAPFITPEKLRAAFEELQKENTNSVIPIVSFGFPILRSFKIEDGKVRMNWPEYMKSRSQDLPQAYHDAGQFYFIKTKVFLEENKLYTSQMSPLILPESEVQDIDTLEDWKIAELKYKLIQGIL